MQCRSKLAWKRNYVVALREKKQYNGYKRDKNDHFKLLNGYQIDYLTFNKTFRNTILHFKTYPSADYGRNHLPVPYYIGVKL